MGGKTAVHCDAEMARRRADIFLTRLAGRAPTATDPRIDRKLGARSHQRPRALDLTCDLMAERERQRAAGADVELLAVAEQKIAVLHVQVGMADAAARDAHQNFGARRLGDVDIRFAQRRAIGGEGLAVYLHGQQTLHAAFRLPSENIGEPHEAFDRNFLRPRRRLNAGRLEQRDARRSPST